MSHYVTCAECNRSELVEDGDNSFRVMRRHVCTTWDDQACRGCATGVPHSICFNGRVA